MIDNKFDTKLLLTIEVRGGAVSYGQTVTETIRERKINSNGKEFWVKTKRKYRPLIEKPSQMKLKVSNVAYESFINDVPTFWKPWDKKRSKEWKKLSVDERLKINLDRWKEQVNGSSYTYEIIDE